MLERAVTVAPGECELLASHDPGGDVVGEGHRPVGTSKRKGGAGVTDEVVEQVDGPLDNVGGDDAAPGVAVINEVFAERGIALPLPDQATVAEDERFERGRAIQHPLYGDEIRDNLAGLPDDLRGVVPRLLTEFCFGDFYTRSGLDLALRELLVLCVLAALGGADVQVRGHAAGNLKAGNTVEVQIAAMIHCLPYIGFPRALNAIRAINELATSASTRDPPELPDGRSRSGVERVLVASSGLGRLALELPAARVSGWLLNEASTGRGPVTAWLERGEQRSFIRSARRDAPARVHEEDFHDSDHRDRPAQGDPRRSGDR